MSKKAKMLLAAIFILLFVIIAGIASYFYILIGASDIVVLKDEVTVEYGQEVSLDKDVYLNKDAINSWAYSSIELTSELLDTEQFDYNSFTNTVVTKGKNSLACGEYILTFKLQSKSEKVILKVEDTIAPKFTGVEDEIVVEADAQDLDLNDFFTVYDYNEYTLEIKGDYDFSKAGNYSVTLVAKDAADNETTAETVIKVISSKDAQSKGSKLLTVTLDGTTPVSKATEKQIVAGKVTNITNPVGYEGNAISKGQYSNPEDQEKYEAELAKKEQEEKEAAEKAAAELEAQQKALEEQQNAITQQQSSQTYTNNSTGSSNTSSSSNYQSTGGTATTNNSDGTKTITTIEPVQNITYSYSGEACDLSEAGISAMTNTLKDSDGNVYTAAYSTQSEASAAIANLSSRCDLQGKTIMAETVFIPGHFDDGTNMYFHISVR